MVAINSTISFAAIPSVPFGGVKDSGYGRVHGPEGLLEYTYARTVVRTRFNVPLNLLSSSYIAEFDVRIVIIFSSLNMEDSALDISNMLFIFVIPNDRLY
jgi:aldehyde dehydrogenase (NAD+)